MNLKKVIKNIIDKLTGGTEHNYYSHLAEEGFLQRFLYKLFLKKIKFNFEKINKLKETLDPENSVVIYVTKYKRNFDFILYNAAFKDKGHPVPTLGFNFPVYLFHPLKRFFRITFTKFYYLLRNFKRPNPFKNGFYEEMLDKGNVFILPCIVKNSFYDRFVRAKTDPFKFLIDYQNRTGKTIHLVPQLIFYSKTPVNDDHRNLILDSIFGTRENPGRLRRVFTMLKGPSGVFVETDDPVNLKEYLLKENIKNLNDKRKAEILRKDIVSNLNIHRQSITGPVIKSRDEQREIVLTNETLNRFFQEYSKENDIPLHAVYKEANDCFDEIATKYSFNVAKVLLIFVRWLINTIFDGVTYNLDALLKIRDMSKNGPVIFIPCHKSHIDYLVLPYVLMSNNFPNPHALAGKNLFFFPVGKFLKAVGAISIRRTFKNSKLYSVIFAEYIKQLLSEGFNIENFIEGGRTRSGKILAPKLGFISILLNAYQSKACKDITFAPVFISYDRVIEEKAYLKEIGGGNKTKESFFEFIKAGKILNKRYGKIYLKFGEGISLKNFLQEKNVDPGNDLKTACEMLGTEIIDSLNRNSIVTPHSIIASAILNSSKRWIAENTIFETIDMFMRHIRIYDAELAVTIQKEHKYVFKGVLDNFVDRKFIEIKDEEEAEKSYIVPENKRIILDFYRNNNIIFFIPAAFVSASILKLDSINFGTKDLVDEYEYLKNLFRIEFTYLNKESTDRIIRRVIKSFIDENILEPDLKEHDRYKITVTGYKKIKFYSAFIKCYFESYFVVLRYLQRAKDDEDFQKIVKKAHVLSSKMFENQEIKLKESVSRINIKNGVSVMIDLTKEERRIHKGKIRGYLELI